MDVVNQNAEMDRGAKCFAFCILRKNELIDDNANTNITKIKEWFDEDNDTQITDEQLAKCSNSTKSDLCDAAYSLINCLPYE